MKKNEVLSLAVSIAGEKAELTGKDYFSCIVDAMEEACKQLGVDRKGVIRMWMEG